MQLFTRRTSGDSAYAKRKLPVGLGLAMAAMATEPIGKASQRRTRRVTSAPTAIEPSWSPSEDAWAGRHQSVSVRCHRRPGRGPDRNADVSRAEDRTTVRLPRYSRFAAAQE